MIPSHGILDSVTLPIGWIAFHKKAIWLGVRFPFYVRKFLMRMPLALGHLMPNGWRYRLCLTLISRELVMDLDNMSFHENEKD